MNINKRAENSLVLDVDTAKAILRNINWNFYQRSIFSPHETHPFDCRKHHWFPATFVPEIPFTLIETLTLPNAVVYDPFAGIGTTYFQTLLLTRMPLATEICRVAVEYMQSLFILFDPKINHELLLESIKKSLKKFDPCKDYIQNVPEYILIDKLTPWYSEKTLNQLSFLFSEEESCMDRAKKAAMRISISAILKTSSSQDRGWGCIADNVLPKKRQIKDKGALKLFEKHVDRLIDDISEHIKRAAPGYAQTYEEFSQCQTIFHEDIRDCMGIRDDSVDLVVTSPPYPNMTDYVTSQRLSYYFLGFELTDRDLEIGARSKRASKDSLSRYLEDMQKSTEIISRKLKKGGYVCYVMPFFGRDSENNRNRRYIVEKILYGMSEYGLMKEEEYERILPTIRRSHNIKWASLEREKIYLFRKV
jgi:DNA modification methylase